MKIPYDMEFVDETKRIKDKKRWLEDVYNPGIAGERRQSQNED